MFCPNCGTETREAPKFCKKCGVNLRRVQGVMGKGGASATSWEEQWLEERKEEFDHKRNRTPEEKRLHEIKAGVITTSVGLGAMIFLRFLFQAIASTLPWQEANVLRGLWWMGWVPFLIGLGIIFNGLFVSKKIAELRRQEQMKAPQPKPLFPIVPSNSPVSQLPEANLTPVADYSIAEPTTARLREPIPRDTN